MATQETKAMPLNDEINTLSEGGGTLVRGETSSSTTPASLTAEDDDLSRLQNLDLRVEEPIEPQSSNSRQLHPSTTESDQTDIFRKLESYPWKKDKEFQGGLSAILGKTSSPSQVQELTLRAQCFYFSRKKLKGAPIDFDGYKAYLLSSPIQHQAKSQTEVKHTTPPHHEADLPPASAPNTAEANTAPYPQSFSDIVKLITSGGTVPGIREIPDTLLTDQATKPMATKRRKPWEKDVPEVQNEGTFGDRRDEYIEQEVPDV